MKTRTLVAGAALATTVVITAIFATSLGTRAYDRGAAMTAEPGYAMLFSPDAVSLHEQFQPRDYSSVEVGSGIAALPPVAPREPSELPRVAHSDITAMVIRTADASIEVDSLEPAIAAIRELAARVGGYVANASLKTGRNRLRSARIEVKLPAPRFDEALAGLSPIGKLEAVNVAAQDVGEEFVDVTARMENARRLERRLIDLLAARTGKLKDVLDVEQALARVREEIERYEGRLRYLRAHTATSTLTILAHEPVPVVGEAGSSVMGEAFKQAWRNFVTFLAVLVQALGVILPLGALGMLAWLAYRNPLLRRLRRGTALE